MGARSRFFAFTYDRFSKGSEEAGLAEMRRNLIAGASGDVLEIGAGTGANLAYYGARVQSLTLTEPERPMLKRLQRKAGERNSRATVLRAPAEDLPFEDASFDTVVSTLVLAASTTSRVWCASSAACSGPAEGSSSSGMFARTTRAWRRCRTG